MLNNPIKMSQGKGSGNALGGECCLSGNLAYLDQTADGRVEPLRSDHARPEQRVPRLRHWAFRLMARVASPARPRSDSSDRWGRDPQMMIHRLHLRDLTTPAPSRRRSGRP